MTSISNKDSSSNRIYDAYGEYLKQVCGREIDEKALKSYFSVFRRLYLPHLPSDRNARILELGCGYGSFLLFLKEQGYNNLLGVDISRQQVKTAHKLGLEKGILQSDCVAFCANQPPETFNAIVMIDLLEHMKKDKIVSFLTDCSKILKPGGKLLVQSPNAANPFWGVTAFGDFTHEVTFTPTSIKQVLLAAGFNDVKVLALRPCVRGIKSLIRAVIWRLIELGIKLYLIIDIGICRADCGIYTQNLLAIAAKISTVEDKD
jgi:2-polyprenyl-3-methyl-5-hydroxy-6-metoxy-1,4-benzoquinol methylase